MDGRQGLEKRVLEAWIDQADHGTINHIGSTSVVLRMNSRGSGRLGLAP